MRKEKDTSQLVMYIASTILNTGGTALCLAGLLLPNWYTVEVREGIVVARSTLGLWQDKICTVNGTCTSHWFSDDNYSRPDNLVMPAWNLIQGFETAATATAVLSLVTLLPLWLCFKSNSRLLRTLTFALFYASSMIAALFSIIGCLIIASKANKDFVDFAPLLSGIGGALMFISACLACVVCRYDPTYGTLENPVSPTFVRA